MRCKKTTDKSIIVEKQLRKGIQISFDELIESPHRKEDFTTIRNATWYDQLSELQKQAIDNIETYWINKIRNFQNWKFSKHWGYEKETISARIDDDLYILLKNQNINKTIINFVRSFLRKKEFRMEFREILRTQIKEDMDSIMGIFSEPKYNLDPTAFRQKLIELYPNVVSGEFKNLEKELFVFYCYFYTPFSVSYILRCALIHFRNIGEQEPIEKGEVYDILKDILEV